MTNEEKTILRHCTDCQFFDECSKICISLDENETFAEVGGCETFQAANDKVKQYREVLHNVTKYMKEKQECQKH